MGQVIPITTPVEKLVLEIRGHVHDAGRAETTCAKHQLQAGLRLIELRACVERDGGDWWAFFDEKFTGYIKSRSYAEKLMRWARADDPEAAREADKTKQREAMQKIRERVTPHVRHAENQEVIDLVTRALRLVDRMSADERETFDAAYQERYR